MNPRDVIQFFRTPVGMFAGFCILLAVGLIVAHHFQRPIQHLPLQLVSSASAAQKSQVVTTLNRDIDPYNPPTSGIGQGNTGRPDGPRKDEERKPTLPPINLFDDEPAGEPKPLSANYAPFGRLIPCELVVTVDSSTIRTPIIGLVTEDIYYAGHLLIPAGTEVHGVAQVDRARERIGSDNKWTLVLQDGEELSLTGIALDRDTDTNGVGWDITDGSAGLRGRLIKTDDLAEIKLFAASFLSAAASALTENQQTVLGTEVLPTTQNAALVGAQGVLGAYANQIYDSIQRDGFYVRVPAGKEFYLYVTQTIDRENAAIGESRTQPNGINDTPPKPQSQSIATRIPIVPTTSPYLNAQP